MYLHHSVRQSQLLAQCLTLMSVGGTVAPVEVSELEYLVVAHLCPLALLLMLVLLQTLRLTPI